MVILSNAISDLQKTFHPSHYLVIQVRIQKH